MRVPTKLVAIGAKAKSWFSDVRKAEVAEALIATWCIEYLRLRRVGGFHVVEIVAISLLMLGAKAIISQAGRKRGHVKRREVVVRTKTAPLDQMDLRRDSYRYSRRDDTRWRRYDT